MHRFKANLKGWIGLSRPPFHTVGVLPFLLGSFLAWKIVGLFSNAVFILGVLAVILILLSTYHAGEYFDHEEDKISKKLFHSRFTGGSGVIPSGILSRQVPLWTSLITFTLAAVSGDCRYKKICGGCRGRAWAYSGDYLAEDPRCFIRSNK